MNSELKCFLSVLFVCKERIVGRIGNGSFKETETQFETYDTLNGIIDTRLTNLSLLNEFFKQSAEFCIVWSHRHIHSGVNREFDSSFVVGGKSVAAPKVMNVGPVGNNHTVPIQFFFEPYGQHFVIGME